MRNLTPSIFLKTLFSKAGRPVRLLPSAACELISLTGPSRRSVPVPPLVAGRSLVEQGRVPPQRPVLIHRYFGFRRRPAALLTSNYACPPVRPLADIREKFAPASVRQGGHRTHIRLTSHDMEPPRERNFAWSMLRPGEWVGALSRQERHT